MPGWGWASRRRNQTMSSTPDTVSMSPSVDTSRSNRTTGPDRKTTPGAEVMMSRGRAAVDAACRAASLEVGTTSSQVLMSL